MAQQGMERDFHHMSLHDQFDPRRIRSSAPSQAPQPYRPPGQTYRSYQSHTQRTTEEFPPPPPSGFVDQNFPPPPPEERENIYHEIREDFPPPPPPEGAVRAANYRGPEPVQIRSSSSYSTSYDNQGPGGGYERVVKQATYSVQSSDSSGRSSPYSSQYANISSIQGAYNNGPSPQSYSQYASKPQTTASLGYTSPSSPRQPRHQMDDPVTYAQVSPRLERQIPIQVEHTVTSKNDRPVHSPIERQIPIQHERPKPGPQVPVAQMSMKLEPHSPPKKEPAGKEAEVDALTNLLMQNMESTADPDFFGVCSKCGKKVLGESNGCTAMDQVFHISCFICVGCGTLLRGKSFYAMETKPYCESCYMQTLERCSICSKPITDRLLRATGKPYHAACFVCVVCGKSLDGIPFTVDATNQIHCIEDFHKKFAPRCCVCHQPIMPDKGQEETVRIVAMDKSFHVHCYRCEDCGMLLSSEAEGRGCYPLDDHILCKNCNAKRIQAITTKMATEL